MQFDYSKIPADTINDILEFSANGRPMGHFLTAVMSSEMFEAFKRADDKHIGCMFDLVCFIYNHVSMSCYGSREKVENWIAQKEVERRRVVLSSIDRDATEN